MKNELIALIMTILIGVVAWQSYNIDAIWETVVAVELLIILYYVLLFILDIIKNKS